MGTDEWLLVAAVSTGQISPFLSFERPQLGKGAAGQESSATII